MLEAAATQEIRYLKVEAHARELVFWLQELVRTDIYATRETGTSFRIGGCHRAYGSITDTDGVKDLLTALERIFENVKNLLPPSAAGPR